MKNKKLFIILIPIAIILLLGIYSYYLSKSSVMTFYEIEWCDVQCNENEICNHERQICSNRTNENIKCLYVGDNKCYKKCKSDADCSSKRCVSTIDCPIDICDIDAKELGLYVEAWEVKICQ